MIKFTIKYVLFDIIVNFITQKLKKNPHSYCANIYNVSSDVLTTLISMRNIQKMEEMVSLPQMSLTHGV